MDKSALKIGFIGIGVLGKGLALSLVAQGYQVTAATLSNDMLQMTNGKLASATCYVGRNTASLTRVQLERK